VERARPRDRFARRPARHPRRRRRRGDEQRDRDGHRPAGAERRRDEASQRGPGERGGAIGRGIDAEPALERRLGDDARQLRGPAAGRRGAGAARDDCHGDRERPRHAAHQRGDERHPARVHDQRQAEQPARRRRAVEDRAEHRPADAGGDRPPGEQRRPQRRRAGHRRPEEQQRGPRHLVARPRGRRACEVVPEAVTVY
jgi:hypothetical protein